MSHSVYMFNPDHDMALAVFSPYYKPPADIVGMASDLAALPAWVASPGDVIHVPDSGSCSDWARRGYDDGLLPDVRWTDAFPDMPWRPWGWNPVLCALLKSNGVGDAFVPSSGRLEKIRHFSGRNQYVQLLSDLRQLPQTCGRAVMCASFDQVSAFLDAEPQAVLKAPWSGSGRGVMRVSAASLTLSVEGWIRRIIRTQGCVMAEPLYSKLVDFAMEFHVNAMGKVTFVGYSLFETDAHGNYKSNVLCSDAHIESVLSSYVPIGLLHEVRDHLLAYFGEVLPGVHEGFFGVDMMICHGNCSGEHLLHPLVEVNLRMNMGVFSRLFFNRYCLPSCLGRYAVEFFRQEGDAVLFHERMRTSYPLKISERKIVSGYLPLVPIATHTHYVAYVEMAQSLPR